MAGSPPHTWGILVFVRVGPTPPRITPTYMGNTNPGIDSKNRLEDHPHIHGEYVSYRYHNRLRVGSPPHTWGIRKLGIPRLQMARITPTYMGNTFPEKCTQKESKDHPHIHGEYMWKHLYDETGRGSPPHTWGIQTDSAPSDIVKDHPHIHGEYQSLITGTINP